MPTRSDRPLGEQHDEWMTHLRRQAVSRRTMIRGAVGTAAAGLLVGSGRWTQQAMAAVAADTGTIAGGFVVNGRHLSFADDPTTGMRVGGQYHYRFRYTAGQETGVTADATFMTAPREGSEPFTFTAFADEGIPGPSLDQDKSLLPESDWELWNNGSYDSDDPDNPATTGVNTTSAVIDYGFIALDVTPGRRGQRTTMVLRFINQQGRELDRVVFSRVAGA
jgi:hypothetical protein